MIEGEALVAVRRVDEPAGDERGERRLVRAALGGETPLDHRERALCVRLLDGPRQGKMCAQPMVPTPVVQLGADAYAALVVDA